MPIYNKWSPVIREGIPDYPTEDYRWEAWYDEQYHYIINGYSTGGERITGHYYFHLNFSKLMLLDKDDYETLASPYHVDVYKEITDLIELSMKNGKDFFCWKARDKGWSQLMSSIAVAETQFRKDNTIAAVFPSGSEVDYKETFRDKYTTTWNALPDCMRHSPNPKINNKDIIHYGYEETDPKTGRTRMSGINSKIAFKYAVNKNILKSYRTKYTFIDEVGEMKFLRSLIQANKANLKKGFKKFGMTIMGGTANSDNVGYDQIFEIWHDDVNKYNFEKYFLPYQKALFGFEKLPDGTDKLRFIDEDTGESLTQKAFDEIINDERKNEELKGEEAFNEYRQNHPINEADAFLLSGDSSFSSEKTSEQRTEIKTNKNIQDSIDVGTLYEEIENGKVVVKFRHDPKGHWKILMHPKEGQEFGQKDVIAVDGYKLSQAQYSKSKGGIMVYRPYQGNDEVGNLPICIYLHRPPRKQDFYKDALLTALYYKKQLLYELTDSDFLEWFIDNGYENMLAPRPAMINILGGKSKYPYGIDPSNKEAALERAVEEFNLHYKDILFLEVIEELAVFGKKNTDLAMCYLWCIFSMRSNNMLRNSARKLQTDKKDSFVPYFTRGQNGRIERVNNIQQHENRFIRYGKSA